MEVVKFDIAGVLESINTEINDLKFDRKPAELYNPVKYVLDLGGKRIRPLLAVMGCYLFDNDYEKSIKPAISIELFHNFTLIHDDIMDKAPLRRGKPTVHEKWNQNIALLSGDVALIEAYEYLENLDSSIRLEIFKLFNLTAKQVCEGQQLDMNFEKNDRVSIEEYIEMIGLKTAVLLGFSMYMGARIGSASIPQAQQLYEVANDIGIAFQIKDDYLDVYGDEDKFGKQLGGDIIAQKKTYLLLTALEKADAETLSRLKQVLSSKLFPNYEKVNEVVKIYNRLNVNEVAQKAIDFYFNKALNNLTSIQADSLKKEFLINYFKQLMDRES